MEAEVKYKISEDQYTRLSEQLVKLKFSDAGMVTQEDLYATYEPSTLGGFDFERVRKSTALSGEVEYSWDRKYYAKDKHGNKVRLEDSRDSTAEEHADMVGRAPVDCPRIVKRRHNFTGTISGYAATVSLDCVNFGAGDTYFIEAEIITDPSEGKQAQLACKEWLANNLGVDVVKEARGYLRQYMVHLRKSQNNI